MGHQRQLWVCQQSDQHALRHVVSDHSHSKIFRLSDDTLSHASIDPAVRAARGLPEDLIRLCVGIEDPHDLLDDLERALIDAGAIGLDASLNKYVRVPEGDALTQAVQKLQLESAEEREWLVSAPGKVILFGEHAVVHGVVRPLSLLPLRARHERAYGNELPTGIDSTGVQVYSMKWLC